MDILSETTANTDPVRQFEAWFAEAVAAGVVQPDAMGLATATPDGSPSLRMVLFKGLDEQGFVFFSNYESPKGVHLAVNPHAALVFYWAEMHRQVRVEGTVKRLPGPESDRYFQTRPRGSQLAALASPQSQVIASRDVLESRVQELERAYENGVILRPRNWGGYRVRPVLIEFWQGRPNRLHDRLRYCLRSHGRWDRERLSP